jgi:hypothetical protein
MGRNVTLATPLELPLRHPPSVARSSRAYRDQEGPHAPSEDVGDEKDLAGLAALQHGVAGYPQLLDLGLSKAAVDRRVRRRELHRIHKGVYAVGHTGLSPRGRELGAVLACGATAVLSHRSAAGLWSLPVPSHRRIEVTAARSRKARADILVHTSRTVEADDRAVKEAIPVTSVARTLVDLAEVLSEARLARAVHEAEVRRIFDLGAVDRTLGRVSGRRGRHRLRRVLAAYRPEDHELESEAERRFRALCRRYGLPPAHRGLSRRLLLAAGAPRRGGRRSCVSSNAACLLHGSRSRPCAGRARNSGASGHVAGSRPRPGARR